MVKITENRDLKLKNSHIRKLLEIYYIIQVKNKILTDLSNNIINCYQERDM